VLFCFSSSKQIKEKSKRQVGGEFDIVLNGDVPIIASIIFIDVGSKVNY
jgi:hypothetical protein